MQRRHAFAYVVAASALTGNLFFAVPGARAAPAYGNAISLINCASGAHAPPCGTYTLNQALTSSTSCGVTDATGAPCPESARVGGSPTADCPPQTAFMDIQNSVPTFPVYQLSDVNVTLYAYTYMDAPTRQVTAVIGTSPCASPEHITPGGTLAAWYTSTTFDAPAAAVGAAVGWEATPRGTPQPPSMTFAQAPPAPAIGLIAGLTVNAAPPPPPSPPPPPPHPPPPPFPPDVQSQRVPEFDKKVQGFTSNLDTTITSKIPFYLMWVGIAFGGLVGIMLIFILAYCFVQCLATKPFSNRRTAQLRVEKKTDDEEAAGDETATVGARAMRRNRNSGQRQKDTEETRVRIHL